MHPLMLKEVVQRCRQRIAEGDCPTVAAFTTEQLEDAVVQLAHELAESYERAAQVCDPIRAHTYASENAERYRTQDEWGRSLAKRIRALKGKPLNQEE